MNQFILAQLDPKSNFNFVPGHGTGMILLGLAIGCAIVAACFFTPPHLRNKVVGLFTFLAGLPYVLLFFFPLPINRGKGDAPANALESASFVVKDMIAPVGDIGSILSAFILFLGVASLFRYHFVRAAKQQKDWGFSIVLLVSLVTIAVFGYKDWLMRQTEFATKLESGRDSWTIWNFGKDLMFDGILQVMDGAMFSIIAFYILSAAYRAFRARSIEATVLLASAFIMMASLLGLVGGNWNTFVHGMADKNNMPFLDNFTLATIADWIRKTLQAPSIRGIDFGVGIGLVAMGLRIWLNLEKTTS